MPKSLCFFFSFIMIMLAGCIPPITTTGDTGERPGVVRSLTSTVSATLLLMRRTPASYATNVPTLERTNTPFDIPTPMPSLTHKAQKNYLPFPLPEPTGNVVQNCLSVEGHLAKQLSNGVLILDHAPFNPFYQNSSPYLLELSNGLTVALRPDHINYPGAGFLSPDQKKWFYIEKSQAGANWKVIISTVQDKVVAVADWDEKWGVNAKWLNNQQIVVTPPEESAFPYGTQIVINPFTNSWQEIKPEFSLGLNIDTFFVNYTSTLDHVMYLSGDFYVLETTRNHQVLWKGGISGESLPVWLPGKKVFLVPLGQETPNTNMNYRNDLYQVDLNGQETQLTHFSQSYTQNPDIYVVSVNVSPNGNYIALQIAIGSDEGEVVGPMLMIYDFHQKKVIDTCQVAATNYMSWSPDGKQLGFSIPKDVVQFLETQHTMSSIEAQTVILNVEKWTAWKIDQDVAIVGWMEK